MTIKNISTLSKAGKTKEQKDAAAARNRANGILRAQLHQQKAKRDPITRLSVQRQIDAIGAGKQV